MRGVAQLACGLAILMAGCRSSSANTTFPSAHYASTHPICFGSDGGDYAPIVVWVSTKGVGFTRPAEWSGQDAPSMCPRPPRRWATIHHDVTTNDFVGDNLFYRPSQQVNLATVQNLYHSAHLAGFRTLPTTIGRAWAMQKGKFWATQFSVWCPQDCSTYFDFMQFGGHMVYDAGGGAAIQVCMHHGRPPSPFPSIPTPLKRFERLFAELAALTQFCRIYTSTPPNFD